MIPITVGNALLDPLTEQAKASPRLRMNYDLRNSLEDGSQRMLNVIEPGSPLPMPLLGEEAKWSRKAARINAFVLEVGNFGHKQRRDFSGMSYLKRKFVSFWGRLSDMLRHIRIFPLDSIRFFGGVLRSGLHAAVRGE